MTKLPQNVLELSMAERGLLALRAAVHKATLEHIAKGLPMYFGGENGEVVRVPPEELHRLMSE